MKLNVLQIRHHISHILKEYPMGEAQFVAKEATALAYANLLMEDPEMVTDRHINILRRTLSPQQIMEITHYVLDQIGENAYVNAFRLRCSQILNESVTDS